MNNIHLPPFPPGGAVGPEVCATMRLYLAVWDDLAPEQQQIVAAHVEGCAGCSAEKRMLQQVTNLTHQLEATEPSARVDQAVLNAILARRQSESRQNKRTRPFFNNQRQYISWRAGSLVAVAAVIVLAVLAGLSFFASQQQAFTLPQNLTWNRYVLYHTQTMMGPGQEHYQVVCYNNMVANVVNAETIMDNKLDVVVVQDPQKKLGLDMMHHVAEWNTNNWNIDESMFNLQQLRAHLQDGTAVYQGREQFEGKEVYRIYYKKGQTLLLDMHYMPVNVLEDKNDTGAGQAEYTTVRWLTPGSVPNSMWDMQVPTGFRMGQLPAPPQV